MSFLCNSVFDNLGLDWRSMLFYIGNFLILFGVLIAVLYKPVKKMIINKRNSLNDVYEENEKLKAESENLKAEYDKMVEDTKLESARVAAEVAKAAEERAEAIVADAQAQSKAIIDAAKNDAMYQKEQLKNEYRDSVNKLAVQIAQKLLEREISDADNSALIEQVLSDWED